MCCILQGSWMCSLRGDCSWAILHSSNISPISLLRLLRFFRIMWILKHIKFMRIATLLGGLAVRATTFNMWQHGMSTFNPSTLFAVAVNTLQAPLAVRSWLNHCTAEC
jgi:hypothetical protein